MTDNQTKIKELIALGDKAKFIGMWMDDPTPITNSSLKFYKEAYKARPAIKAMLADNEQLKLDMKDVLHAIVNSSAVNDVIWMDEKSACHSPIGDFIMCSIDEEIDLENLQSSGRCKHTQDIFLNDENAKLKAENERMREACMEAFNFLAIGYLYPDEDGSPEYKKGHHVYMHLMKALTTTEEE